MGLLPRAIHTIRSGIPQDERALSHGVEREDPEWPSWEKERLRIFHNEGKLVFDLFAPTAAELLRRSSPIRQLVAQRFPLVIVDEAQDTWPDAWECVKTLAPSVQVICLADLDQQIFDHLPGIGPERVAEVEATLQPLCVDLGSENNRSAGTEIAAFANDVLSGKVRRAGYKGVMKTRYDPRGEFAKDMRKAVGILSAKLKETAITAIARSLDYLVAFNRGKRISANLSAMWADHGSYIRARAALDAALIEEQMLAGIDDLSGIHAMTIHRSKGKQFDGVIILREGHRRSNGWTSSFV